MASSLCAWTGVAWALRIYTTTGSETCTMELSTMLSDGMDAAKRVWETAEPGRRALAARVRSDYLHSTEHQLGIGPSTTYFRPGLPSSQLTQSTRGQVGSEEADGCLQPDGSSAHVVMTLAQRADAWLGHARSERRVFEVNRSAVIQRRKSAILDRAAARFVNLLLV